MHDAITVEKAGIPAVGVMTSKFVSAADLMARVLGADGYEYAVIDHPISSAGPAALAEQARLTVTHGLAILAGQQTK